MHLFIRVNAHGNLSAQRDREETRKLYCTCDDAWDNGTHLSLLNFDHCASALERSASSLVIMVETRLTAASRDNPANRRGPSAFEPLSFASARWCSRNRNIDLHSIRVRFHCGSAYCSADSELVGAVDKARDWKCCQRLCNTCEGCRVMVELRSEFSVSADRCTLNPRSKASTRSNRT